MYDKKYVLPLEWDTKYFGINCGKSVLDNSINDINIEKFKMECADYDFVAIQNIGDLCSINNLIGANTKAVLMDVNIQFEKKIKEHKAEGECKIVKSSELNAEQIKLFDLAEHLFVFSKFVCDTKLKVRGGELVYQQWLNNSQFQDKYFIFYYMNNQPVSFILFNVEEDHAVIELLLVNPEYAGHNVAINMIHLLENYLFDLKIDILKVGTQLHNDPAINMYHRAGFKKNNQSSVYHLWNI